MIQAYGVQSITPRCNDSQLSEKKIGKNMVELQKFDQELRASYKPATFSGWVVDTDLQNSKHNLHEFPHGDETLVYTDGKHHTIIVRTR